MPYDHPTICIDVTHHEKTRGRVTGIGFTVNYDREAFASVSMLELPPVSDEELPAAFRQRLQHLGEAILKVAQSPQAIFWHHRARG
jgi:hypothetical protein